MRIKSVDFAGILAAILAISLFVDGEISLGLLIVLLLLTNAIELEFKEN